MVNKDPKIIVGFHGIGKTWATQHNFNYSILDFWYNGYQTPEEILKDILELQTQYDFVLIDNSDLIRDILLINNINYYLIYPDIKLKEKYINNFKLLNYDESYIQDISDNWEKELNDISQELFPYKIELKEDMYLLDILDFNFLDK